MRRIIKNWIFGFVFSFLIAWMVSYFFVDRLATYTFDPKLEKYVRSPGSIQKSCSEGYGISKYGEHDIIAIPNIENVAGGKVIIWGDSYVQAWQVHDDEKLAQVITKISKSDGKDLVAFGVAHGDYAVPNYYFDIPKYEKISSNIVAHFIIFPDITDLLPNKEGRFNCFFLSEPNFKLVKKKWQPKFQNIKKILGKLEMHFLWQLARSTILDMELRFKPGPIPRQIIKKKTHQQSVQACSFLIKEIKKITNIPVVFVYLPRIPTISGNKIEFLDFNEDFARKVSEICFYNKVGFINMGAIFNNYFNETGKFPRGFSNSFPSKGHLNPNGHRLVAEIIYSYINDNIRL